MNLQKRGKRQRSGIASRRGPGTSKSFSQIRMHSSQQHSQTKAKAATRSGFRHKVNPVYIPAKSDISPAEYRRQSKKKGGD